MKKKALITGVTGQDGSYLAEFLLEKGYEVHGIKRRASLFNTQRVDHIYQDPHVDNQNFVLHYGDLTDSSNLTRILQQVQPDEVYNLGAQSHVAVSFESPEYTARRWRDRAPGAPHRATAGFRDRTCFGYYCLLSVLFKNGLHLGTWLRHPRIPKTALH
jgi:uncharacterized protein YbjT (DUF2867 family)